MAVPLSAKNMATRINQKVENRSQVTWSDTEVLQAIDEASDALYLTMQELDQDYELDWHEFTVATEVAAGRMVSTSQDVMEWRHPDYIQKIRRIEDVSSGLPVQIAHATLSTKEFPQDMRIRPFQPQWLEIRGMGGRQWIGFMGGLQGVTTIRVWFWRRLAPMHYGNAQPGSDVDTLIFDRSSGFFAGKVVDRDDLYVGSLIEFTSATVPGHNDKLRVVTAYASPYTAQLDEAFASALHVVAPAYAVSYSLVSKIPPEFHELVVLDASVRLAEETGSQRLIATLSPKRAELQARFLNAAQRRQVQTPQFVEVLDSE